MEIFTNNILLDVLLLCFISTAIAIPLFSYSQKGYPQEATLHLGNVPTSSFTPLDILGVFLATLLFTGNLIAMALYPSLAESSSSVDNTSMLMGGLITQLIPVGIACAFILPRMNVGEIFGISHPNIGKVILTGILGLVLIYVCMALINPILMPFLEKNLGKQELQAPVQMIIDAKENNPAMLVILALLAVIVAPICEEFVFRGYLYGTLKRFSCSSFAVIISALFFAVVHANLWAMVPLFIVGVALAIIYEVSGSLWASILTHMLFNGVTTATLIFVNVEDLPL